MLPIVALDRFLVAFFPVCSFPRSFDFLMFVQLSATPRFAGTELDWACRIEIAATVLFPTFFFLAAHHRRSSPCCCSCLGLVLIIL